MIFLNNFKEIKEQQENETIKIQNFPPQTLSTYFCIRRLSDNACVSFCR